jgi:signal transduction histidine kinase
MMWKFGTVFFALSFLFTLWLLLRKRREGRLDFHVASSENDGECEDDNASVMDAQNTENDVEEESPSYQLPPKLVLGDDPVALIRQSLAQLRAFDRVGLAHYLCKPGCPWSNRDVFHDADPISTSVQKDLKELIQELPDDLCTLLVSDLEAYENLHGILEERELAALLLMPMPTLNNNCCWILIGVLGLSKRFEQVLEATARFLASDLALVSFQKQLKQSVFDHEEMETRFQTEKIDAERLQNTLEVNLEQAKSKAEESHRVKNDFLASVSHELRTPLNAIQGYTRIVMREENLSDRQRLSLDRVLASSQNLLKLINNILDYSRLEAGGIQLNLEQINLNQLGQDVLHQIESLAHEKDLALVLDAESELLLFTDRARLERVLINLVGNAIKFTRQGSVRIHMEHKAGTIFIHVIDTGIGISDIDAPRIFERFEQGDRGRELSQTGTGLGLAISRRLIELLGGRIELESTPGEGSTFTLRIPQFWIS